MSHIFLHVSLCNAIAKTAADTVIPIHVRMNYRTGDPPFDKVFRVTRGDGTEVVLEFDIPRDLYRLRIEAPKYKCSTTDYLDVLTDNNRTVTETLVDGPPPPERPLTLLVGTAPMSFTYIRTTFSLFDKSQTCGAPIQAALPATIKVEYDQGAFYVWLYGDPSLDAHAPVVVALRLRTPNGSAHYARLPVTMSSYPGFPNSVRINVTEEMVDDIATDKVDTLLCPKVWETSAH